MGCQQVPYFFLVEMIDGGITMKKEYNKKEKKSHTFVINTAVKIFLFPLFIFGILLREYDRIFKKKKIKKRTEGLWY